MLSHRLHAAGLIAAVFGIAALASSSRAVERGGPGGRR